MQESLHVSVHFNYKSETECVPASKSAVALFSIGHSVLEISFSQRCAGIFCFTSITTVFLLELKRQRKRCTLLCLVGARVTIEGSTV